MARDRFSDLERIYEALKLGNVELSSLPQSLDFVKYGKWREGDAPAANIVRPNLNGEKEVGIVGFGLPSTDDSGKIVDIDDYLDCVEHNLRQL